MTRWIKKIFKALVVLIVLLVVLITILTFAGVTLDIGRFRVPVERSIEAALGRDIDIDGPAYLTFSNWPSIAIDDVKVANVPGGTAPYLLNAGLVRLEIGLFQLLSGEIEIGEITAENITLNLESDGQGTGNWVFKVRDEKKQDKEQEKEEKEQPNDKVDSTQSEGKEKKKLISFAGLNELSLKNIAVNYHDQALNKSFSFQLDSLMGQAPAHEPMKMDMSGRIHEYTYDLSLSGGTIEDLQNKNEPWSFAVTGDVIGRQVNATGKMQLRGDEPEMALSFAVKDVDVGAVMAALGLVEGMQASLGDMALELFLTGDSLKEVLENSTMLFKVRDADWKIAVPNTEAFIDINDVSGDVLVEKGNAVTMKMDGVLKQVPVKLLITGAPAVEYLSQPDSVPLTIEAALLDTRISFSSTVKLPITERDMSMGLKVQSKRLDKFNDLLKLELPPVGPIALDTELNITKAGYDMPKLRLSVGKSNLNGRMNLAMSKAKPALDIELISDLIRLEDFDSLKKKEKAGNSVSGEKAGNDADKVTTAVKPNEIADQALKAEQAAKSSDSATKSLISYEVLNALDANIKVQSKQVTAETNNLGSGLVQLSLKDARLVLQPLRVDVPGGGLQVDMDYTLSADQVALNMKADIKEFDLVNLVRRKKPESDMGGKFTLDAELHSTAAEPQSIMKNANGHFDFALVPKNFSAGVIDLWAVNLLSAIMDKSTEKDKSEINCVVVRFGIKDGIMSEKAIYLDTTNMRIAGKADINFVEEQIDIKMAPKAKNPEFFSVAIPIKLKGSFDDFGIKIGVFRMAGQVVSFVTSPIHVPIRRVFTEKEPADGVEACKIAWTRTAGN